jgi:predicted MFS family arabinose efflux permease
MRDVWLLSMVLLGYNACFQGLLGYTPLFLRNSGWTPYAADLAFALIPIASILATLPITFLSDRFGARRSILVVILFVCMVSTGLMAIMQGPVIWLLCILIGLGRDSFTAISMAMNYEIEEVGADTTAAAMGLVNSVSRIGAVIAPPLGNSLVAIDPGFPFITWAAFILPSFVIFFMHKGNIHAK